MVRIIQAVSFVGEDCGQFGWSNANFDTNEIAEREERQRARWRRKYHARKARKLKLGLVNGEKIIVGSL